jgi:hypothetical protein
MTLVHGFMTVGKIFTEGWIVAEVYDSDIEWLYVLARRLFCAKQSSLTQK